MREVPKEYRKYLDTYVDRIDILKIQQRLLDDIGKEIEKLINNIENLRCPYCGSKNIVKVGEVTLEDYTVDNVNPKFFDIKTSYSIYRCKCCRKTFLVDI